MVGKDLRLTIYVKIRYKLSIHDRTIFRPEIAPYVKNDTFFSIPDKSCWWVPRSTTLPLRITTRVGMVDRRETKSYHYCCRKACTTLGEISLIMGSSSIVRQFLFSKTGDHIVSSLVSQEMLCRSEMTQRIHFLGVSSYQT